MIKPEYTPRNEDQTKHWLNQIKKSDQTREIAFYFCKDEIKIKMKMNASSQTLFFRSFPMSQKHSKS